MVMVICTTVCSKSRIVLARYISKTVWWRGWKVHVKPCSCSMTRGCMELSVQQRCSSGSPPCAVSTCWSEEEVAASARKPLPHLHLRLRTVTYTYLRCAWMYTMCFRCATFSSTWYSCPCPRLQQGYSFALQRGLCSQSLAKVPESLQDVQTVEYEGFGAGTYFDVFCDVLF